MGARKNAADDFASRLEQAQTQAAADRAALRGLVEAYAPALRDRDASAIDRAWRAAEARLAGAPAAAERPAPSAPAPQYKPYTAREACTLEHGAVACRYCGETAELVDAAEIEALRADRELLRRYGVALTEWERIGKAPMGGEEHVLKSIARRAIDERALALAAQGRGR